MTARTDMDPGRRELLARAARAGLATAALGAGGLWLHQSDPPAPRASAAGRAPFDFRVTGEGPALARILGDDRRALLRRALQALGGLERFVRPGERVLIKVNAAFASPAALGATTHPGLVAELTRLCLTAGAARVVVSDNPIADPASAFAVSGIGLAAREAGATVLVPRPADFTRASVEGAALLTDWPILLAPLLGADRVISLAPVKHHHRAAASMTLKNQYGLLGGARNVFHQDINGIVRDLSVAFRPTLVVLDGVQSLIANGPTGGSASDLRATRTLLAGTDPVAVDAAGAALLGLRPEDVPYLGMAEAAGVGRLTLPAGLVREGGS
jgi:uncharacterized protein (DUF362 family)